MLFIWVICSDDMALSNSYTDEIIFFDCCLDFIYLWIVFCQSMAAVRCWFMFWCIGQFLGKIADIYWWHGVRMACIIVTSEQHYFVNKEQIKATNVYEQFVCVYHHIHYSSVSINGIVWYRHIWNSNYNTIWIKTFILFS